MLCSYVLDAMARREQHTLSPSITERQGGGGGVYPTLYNYSKLQSNNNNYSFEPLRLAVWTK